MEIKDKALKRVRDCIICILEQEYENYVEWCKDNKKEVEDYQGNENFHIYATAKLAVDDLTENKG